MTTFHTHASPLPRYHFLDWVRIIAFFLLSITCANVHSALFLPRAVLLTALVPDRRHFPVSRRPRAGGSATRYRMARLG